MIEIRKAVEADIPAIMTILDSARQAQRALGFRQWDDGYPGEDVVRHDINASLARVLVVEGAVAGYAAVVENDPGYTSTDAAWIYCGRFAVIHRLAIGEGYRRRHLSRPFMTLLEEESRRRGIEAMRVDTGESNTPMRRLLAGLSYTSRGPISFPWGPRLAFEKPLRG